jgi:secondary thiamine-phosphate synthase enzyme
MIKISVNTTKREQFVDITAKVQEAVSKFRVKDGIVCVYVPHTTAGVTINENADPDVVHDMLLTLGDLVPNRSDYRHREGNSDAHVKYSMMGCSLNEILENGRLQLGTWQSIYFTEFDGPRNRQVWITVTG